MHGRIWSRSKGLVVVLAAAAWALLCVPGNGDPPIAATPATVEFNRDIRPILSDNCYQCHGPDQAKRKANLRLDTEQGAFANLGGYRAIVPGKPAESEIITRLTHADPAKRMPQAKTGRKLTESQIALIRRWIEQGAKWQPHWAFIAPQRSPLPSFSREPAASASATWPRNAIDHFILARLQREGLTPSPEADKVTLIRRVTLDLTGLPPTPAEVDAFLADSSPDAYEKLVDRLLASPRYGERMARPWLDAARYADTNGYQSDGERFMWRWRDWVIDALNSNMPFDQFTIEQLAGDMLPNATLDQKIASGFNRNHRGNGEGGVIPEEYAVEYVVDRVDTTATVWLGLTAGCARCHDHKFDPISQREFYQFFAYFNNVPERGKAIKFGNSPPMIKAPTREQQQQLTELETRLTAAEAAFARLDPEVAKARADWEKSLNGDPSIAWSIGDGLILHDPLDEDVPGKVSQAAAFDGKRSVNAGEVADFGFYDKFTLSAWVYPKGDKGGVIIGRTADSQRGVEGYALQLEAGKVQVNLVKRWLDDAIRVETEERLEADRWHHITATYEGSRLAAGIKIYIDGRPARIKVNLDDLNQTFQLKEPFRIGSGGESFAGFHGLIDEVRVYNRAASAEEAAILSVPESIPALAVIPPENRTAPQALKLKTCFLETHAPEPIRQARRRVRDLRDQRDQLLDSIPTTMVMEEMPTPRETYLLVRGAYDKPGERVMPGVPATLQASRSPSVGMNRLDFARWLVDPSNPLTARVAVNRYWQMYFGTGLVKTVDDFGAQGDPPSHPELLDWLACEFMSPSPQPSPPRGEGARRGWDVKALQRLIVTSATYRQSSKVTPALLQKDPDNRLLARGPRLRLPAEMVRDQALFASGLLVEQQGGPSVKPYQPAGLVKELTGTEDYQQDTGEGLYRRSLYTFWKRTVAPPQMLTFDAAGRETCVVRETRTNTPLQALTLLNDVTYVEAARVLAQRIMTEAGRSPEDRLTLAFRVVTARNPSPAELKVLVSGFHAHLADYRNDPEAAAKLVGTGEYPRNAKLDVPELAAYSAVAGMILNLDEAVTKE